jgi:hypothetical protein
MNGSIIGGGGGTITKNSLGEDYKQDESSLIEGPSLIQISDIIANPGDQSTMISTTGVILANTDSPNKEDAITKDHFWNSANTALQGQSITTTTTTSAAFSKKPSHLI